jgi:hypothetical protein
MAELLMRKCNVAIPDVDVGEDLFAFMEGQDEIARLQIKTGQAKRYRNGRGYRAQFSLPLRQIEKFDKPVLFYVLAVRLDNWWEDVFIIRRAQVKKYLEGPVPFGSENRSSGDLVLTLRVTKNEDVPEDSRCGGVDMSPYCNAWSSLPPLRPLL